MRRFERRRSLPVRRILVGADDGLADVRDDPHVPALSLGGVSVLLRDALAKIRRTRARLFEETDDLVEIYISARLNTC
jgi:hypothetical protein